MHRAALALPSLWRRLTARRALRAGERARALVQSQGRDPVVLAGLGMHGQTLAILGDRGARSRAEQLVHIQALAATGQTDLAVPMAQRPAGRASPSWRRHAALAIGPVDPRAALDLLDARHEAHLRAALMAHAGEVDAAVDQLADTFAASPDVVLLRASLAIEQGELHTHAALINAAFEACGLEPVRRADPGAPLSVRNVTATTGRTIEGPLVSVIMAVRDVLSFIDAAIGSVLGQTWTNLELIVVDDGSLDGTPSRVEEWCARDARVQLIRRVAPGGPYRGRNAGLASARGTFVTFHDGDDWAHPSRLERQIAPLAEDPRLIATATKWFRLDDEGRICARQVWPLVRWHPASPLFRREPVLRTLGVFDEVQSGADCEYWARLAHVFGPRRTRTVRLPLSLGSLRADSLTRAPGTGFSDANAHPGRLAYWEAWNHWHARAYREGTTPCMPPAAARPFAAPADLLVPADR